MVVSNLRLSNNNSLRLIKPQRIKRKKLTEVNQDKLARLIGKAKLLGAYKEIQTICGIKAYIISTSKTNHTIIIPNKVTSLNGAILTDDKKLLSSNDRCFTYYIKDLKGNIKVIGGSGLVDATGMFQECEASTFDFSQFDTSNIRKMNQMFSQCKNVKSLDLSYFNTSSLESIQLMFYRCNAEDINFSSFSTHKLYCLDCFLRLSKASNVDLSTFKINSDVREYIKMNTNTFNGYHGVIEATDLALLYDYVCNDYQYKVDRII